jgi:hypothetical protein
LALLAVSLARLGPGAFSHADTSSYLIPGNNLLLHGRFIADGVPDLLRTPGYPLFLALASLGGQPTALAASMILSIFSLILVWRLGRAVFRDDRIALGAAWIFAFEPISVVLSYGLMSDTLFLVFVLLSMERLVEFLRGHRLQTLAVAGLWLAAATYVRSVTYYLPFALALGLFLALARIRGLRWKAPAVLLLSILPWLAAWQVRNWVETGYSGFSSVSEENLYFLSAADVTARMEHRPSLVVSGELGYGDFSNNAGQSYLYPDYLARHPEQAGWNQAQRLAYMRSEAVRVIRAHYGGYLRSCLIDLFTTTFYPAVYYQERPAEVKDPQQASSSVVATPAGWRSLLAKAKAAPWNFAEKIVFEVALLSLYLLALLGVCRSGAPKAFSWLLVGTAIYFLVVSAAATGALPAARLRLPVMPVASIYCAVGFWRAKKFLR